MHQMNYSTSSVLLVKFCDKSVVCHRGLITTATYYASVTLKIDNIEYLSNVCCFWSGTLVVDSEAVLRAGVFCLATFDLVMLNLKSSGE